MIVKPAIGEKTDSVAVEQSAPERVGFPKMPCFPVQVRREIAKIIRSGIFALPASEKIKKILIGGQVFHSREFEIQQENMVAVQIYGCHGSRVREEIIQSIAAAG